MGEPRLREVKSLTNVTQPLQPQAHLTSVLEKYVFQVERRASWPPMSHMRKWVFRRTTSSTLLPMVGHVWTTSFIRLEG